MGGGFLIIRKFNFRCLLYLIKNTRNVKARRENALETNTEMEFI